MKIRRRIKSKKPKTTDTWPPSSTTRSDSGQIREKFGLFSLHACSPDKFDFEYVRLKKVPADSTRSIVAVHGLGGDWERTWTDSESSKLWLRDFVPEQFSNLKFRISSYGYDFRTLQRRSVKLLHRVTTSGCSDRSSRGYSRRAPRNFHAQHRSGRSIIFPYNSQQIVPSRPPRAVDLSQKQLILSHIGSMGILHVCKYLLTSR